MTYGELLESASDYLRDNMSVSPRGIASATQPAIVIGRLDLIDGRAAADHSVSSRWLPQAYYDFARTHGPRRARAIPRILKGAAEEAGADYEYDEKHKIVAATEQGVEKIERALASTTLCAAERSPSTTWSRR